jgi:hypothetical protein
VIGIRAAYKECNQHKIKPIKQAFDHVNDQLTALLMVKKFRNLPYRTLSIGKLSDSKVGGAVMYSIRCCCEKNDLISIEESSFKADRTVSNETVSVTGCIVKSSILCSPHLISPRQSVEEGGDCGGGGDVINFRDCLALNFLLITLTIMSNVC